MGVINLSTARRAALRVGHSIWRGELAAADTDAEYRPSRCLFGLSRVIFESLQATLHKLITVEVAYVGGCSFGHQLGRAFRHLARGVNGDGIPRFARTGYVSTPMSGRVIASAVGRGV
jgi:hypothetical protein